MKAYRRREWIFGILSLLILTFIFTHSFQPAPSSDGESRTFVQILQELLDPQGRFTVDEWHGIVRKIAHFAEFAALGFCVAGFTAAVGDLRRRRYRSLPLLVCLLTAACDETIQTFIPGRSGMPTDVLLDFAGSLFGAAVCLGLVFRAGKE